MFIPAQAKGSGISVDFAASYYLSYDHKVGGGAWDHKVENFDTENSLAGSEFKCNDWVTFLTEIKVDNSTEMADNGKMTMALDYKFDGNTTGQPGVAYSEFGEIKVNRAPIVDLVSGEDAVDADLLEVNADSQLALINEHKPTLWQSPVDNLTGTVEVSNLEAGETVIVSIDVKIVCKDGASPTGNILARIPQTRLIKIHSDETLSTPITVSSGEKTVPLQRVGNLVSILPELGIVKTVVKGVASCAGATDFVEISPGGTVTYCYSVTNPSNITSAPGAPMYNVSPVVDDNARPLDSTKWFQETLTGLTDIDGDGQSDDLAAGATATAFHVKKFNGEMDTYETNTATVTGFDAPTGGNQVSAFDTAVVFIDPPLAISLSLVKLTNGADGGNIIVGTPITWTYDVTNTGDDTLTDIIVIDDQGVSVSCPETTLAPAATMQCSASGSAIGGLYSNLGTVTGSRGTETATAEDDSFYFGANPQITMSKTPKTQTVEVGGPATFTITVSNTGNVDLADVNITDSQTAECAQGLGTLLVGETETVICSLDHVTESFINTAVASGTFESTTVSDVDTASVTAIALHIVKLTNGADGLHIISGTPITWTYDVTNTGDDTLTGISVVDDLEGAISCPETTLAPTASMQCSASGTWVEGDYLNVGTVTGFSGTETATAHDDSDYFGANPHITMSKTPKTQVVEIGKPATFTITVTNTGNVDLTNVNVIDTQTAECAGPLGDFIVGHTEIITCSLDHVTDSFINTAVVYGAYESTTVSDVDTASVTAIALSLVKLTNGKDGGNIISGTPVTWTYTVTNIGDDTLTGITLSDDQEGVITCPYTTLAPAANMICSETGTATVGRYYNIATVTGFSGTETATAHDDSFYSGVNPQISISKTPKTQTVVAGGVASFTITVTNTGNVILTNANITDTQTPDCAHSLGTLLVGETETVTCSLDPVTASFINTAVASGTFESTTVTDLDTATVTVDFLPEISVTKSANPTSVPETGGNVEFTFVVTNNGVENFILSSLVDDKFGNLNGQGDCVIPETITASGNYSCKVTKLMGNGTLTPFTNTVTASGVDPEGNPASETATAGVTFTDVLPHITLTKSANPTKLPLIGGLVTYTFTITNTGTETVTVGSLIDPLLTLSAPCLALVTQTLAPSAFLSCSSSETVTSTTGLPFVNTATATAHDNENNVDTATASATVTFVWYGRTPGYWKNHTNKWPETFTASALITSVFFPTGDVPSFLKSGGILNLNSKGGADSLLDALAYKGGTDIKGAAQILLRAAVAAVLNEKYYGNLYPGSDTVEHLIKLVHDTMTVNSRSAYLALATVLDKWNNGIEASL